MQNIKKSWYILGRIRDILLPLAFFLVVFLLAANYFQDKAAIIINSLKWIFR